jgi:translocation and assembly module TamB
VALSLAMLLISTEVGKALLVPRVLQAIDEALAGRIELRSFRILTQGGIELSGARVVDPDGDIVLEVERARLYVDLGRLRQRVVSCRVELLRPTVVLKREEDGSLSIARAFAPTHPKPKEEPSGPFTWTVRLTSLVLEGGSVKYVDAAGQTAYEATKVDLRARGAYGPHSARAEVDLKGDLLAPERAPVSVTLAGGLRGSEVRVRQLRAAVGETALDLAGVFDWVSWKGRAAVLALSVDADQVRAVAPRAPLAGDLAGTLYLESDGAEASAALQLAPRQGGGRADAAAALRLPPGAFAAGADVHLAALDLSRVLRGAPPTALSLDARARGTGKDLATLRGALALSLAPSRLRTGQLGPVEVRAGADRGAFELSRLDASLPGGAVHGSGRWRRGGEVAAQATVEGADLAQLRRNLELLLGRPLPALAGTARAEVALTGTEAAPAAHVALSAPSLALGGTSLTGLGVTGDVAGPWRAPRVQLDGGAARLVAGGLDARTLKLHAHLVGRSGEVRLTGAVPEVGPDALAVSATGTLAEDRSALALTALTLAWPGDRFELASPARVRFAPPAVDRLVLAFGDQRLAISGGLLGEGAHRAVDARVEIERLDLAKLPRQLLPEKLALAGRVRLDVRATGPLAAPQLAGQVELTEGALLGLEGLQADGTLAYDGAKRRARVDLTATRATGGEVAVRAEVPVLLTRAGPAAALSAHVSVRSFPVTEALRMARPELAPQVDGLASLEADLGGTVGAPSLSANATLEQGRYADLDALAVTLKLEHVRGRAHLVGAVDRNRRRALDVDAGVPLDLAALLREPGRVGRALPDAPLAATLAVPGLDLAGLAGKMGVPEGLAGTLSLKADLSGHPRAPRGKVTVAVAGGAYAGYRALDAKVDLAARDGATEVAAEGSMAGAELVRVAASVALPVERLGERSALEAAELRARVEVPRADLRQAGASVPLAGEIVGLVELSGHLSSPRLTANLTGRKVEVSGRPVGDVALEGGAAEGRLHAKLHVAVATGGTLDGALDAEGDLGLEAIRRGDLGRVPARARLVASELDLGVVPALAQGYVRSAEGKLGADLTAAGPLARMTPRGTIAVAGGRLAIAEWGDWTGVVLSASITEDVVRIDRLEARRGSGAVTLHAEAKGLARKDRPGDLRADLRLDRLPVARAGQDFATVTAQAKLSGTVSRSALDAELNIPDALVKLPDRLPTRKIQPLDRRPDIVVGSFRKKAKAAGAEEEGGESQPYHAKVHLLVPGHLQVKGDSPRVDITIKADVTADYEGELTLTGDVDTIRGSLEPMGGRNFELRRGHVHFTGEDYSKAALEIQAFYDNPQAKVTVAIGGTIGKPDVKLTSEPPMDESQIALLIATGHVELKANTGGYSAQDVGFAALGALGQQFFKDVIGDKLPVDSVSLDSSQLRAGKYVSDKIYVGYTRRGLFGSTVEQGENTNEVRAEYQITPRWNFELRYGDANTGGASLIWSKDY